MHSHTKFAPLLTRADEGRLAAAIAAGREARLRIDNGEARAGDNGLITEAERARQQFIEANVRLVLSLARRIRIPAHFDRDDVVQDGMIGLERAVERFDHTKGFKFSTYAAWWIRQAMQRGLEQTSTTIRIPEHKRGALRAAQRERDQNGVPLTDELAQLERVSSPDSLDREIDDDATSLGTVLAGSADDPAQAAEQSLLGEAIDDLLDDLDPVLADAIARRFGLRGHEPTTYARVAAALGRNEESIRRQVNRALERLRPRALEFAA